MAKKKLNKNIVVAITLFVLAMGVVAGVLMIRQLKLRDPKYFVELANRYAAESEWRTAALFYRKAWERGHDAKYLVAQGGALLNDGEVGLSLRSFNQALINEPNLTEAHIRKLDLCMELAGAYGNIEDWNRVRDTADAFLASEGSTEPEQLAAAHHAKGLALVRPTASSPDDLTMGEAELRKAIELAPDRVAYALDLFGFLVSHKRADEGEALLADLTDRYDQPGANGASVRLARAKYLASKREWPEAAEAYLASLTLAQTDPEALREARLGYAVFLGQRWALALHDDPNSDAAQGYFDEAERLLRASIETDAERYAPYLQLATLYGAAGRLEDVVNICDTRLKRGLVRKGIAQARNRINTFNLLLRASRASVDAAEKARQDGDETERQRWLTKADEYVASAQGEYPDRPPVLSQAGRVKLARGLERQALEDFRRADEGYRAYNVIDWENKFFLASLHLRLNEAGAAKAVLEEVLADPRRPRAADSKLLLLYGQALFKTDDLDRALAVADRLLIAEPDNANALRIKAAVFERQGRAGEAAHLVETGIGDRVIAAILHARERTLNGDSEGAVTILREAMKKDATDDRLVSALTRQLLVRGEEEQARRVVEGAISASPDDLRLQAVAVLTRDDLTEEQRDKQMLEIIRRQEDDYQRALELVDFHVRRQHWTDAMSSINEALAHLSTKDTPAARNANLAQHRALLAAKAALAAELGDEAAMASARDEAAEFNVDGVGGRTLLGLYHLHRKEYDLAIKALTEATTIQPTDARSLAYLGQCYQASNRAEDARAAFERAIRVNPNEGLAHRGLAALAQARGDGAAFEKALTVCKRLIPEDPWVKTQVLAETENDHPEDAIAARQRQLESKPDDFANLYRLAALCEKVNRLGQADGYYEHLLKLQPDNKELVVAVSRFFRRTKRPDRSLAVTRHYAESRETAEDRANARILIASHYLSEGDDDRVEQTLLDAAKIAETLEVSQSLAEYFLQRARQPALARPWLDKAVEQARAVDSPRLAQLMTARASCELSRAVNDTAAARTHLNELLVAFPNYPPAILLQANLNARLGEIDDAIASLTEYLRWKPDHAVALYQRALHYWSQGRVTRAIEDLSAMERAHPLALNLEPRFVLAMLQRESGHRDLWVQELESLVRDAPDSTRAIEELTRAYANEGRLPEAERLATTRINVAGDQPSSRWLFLRSRIALELGDADKALSDAQRGADIEGHTPESLLSVLAIALRADRPADGVAYYKRYASSKPESSALASGYALLLVKIGNGPEGVRRFRVAMQLAMKESPAARGRVLADLRAAFPTAEALSSAITAFEHNGDASSNRADDRILADLHQMAGQVDLATKRLQRLIATATDDHERSDLHQDLGTLLQGAGRMDEARAAFEEALKYNGENWLALNNLAYLLSDHFGQNDKARAYAERAVAIADVAPTLDTLGWIYVGLGDYRRAIAELSRALRLAPNDPLSYYHLGEAYRRTGDMEVAGSVLRAGLHVARTRENDDLTTRFEAAIERVGTSDSKP